MGRRACRFLRAFVGALLSARRRGRPPGPQRSSPLYAGGLPRRNCGVMPGTAGWGTRRSLRHLSLYLLRRLCYILPGTRQTPLRPSEAGNPTLAADPRGCLWITWTLSAVVLENAAAWSAAGDKALRRICSTACRAVRLVCWHSGTNEAAQLRVQIDTERNLHMTKGILYR